MLKFAELHAQVLPSNAIIVEHCIRSIKTSQYQLDSLSRNLHLKKIVQHFFFKSDKLLMQIGRSTRARFLFGILHRIKYQRLQS